VAVNNSNTSPVTPAHNGRGDRVTIKGLDAAASCALRCRGVVDWMEKVTDQQYRKA
jgi:hypothetical protein